MNLISSIRRTFVAQLPPSRRVLSVAPSANARFFDMKVGDPKPQDLELTMSNVGPLWEKIRKKNELVVGSLNELVSWRFANYVFGTTWDVMSDSMKIRRYGFHDLIDSEEMFLTRLQQLQRLRVIPE